MKRAVTEWPNSCEAVLTASSINHQAWMGHAGCALNHGAPEEMTRLGWRTLTIDEQDAANLAADRAITFWKEKYAPNFKKENMYSICKIERSDKRFYSLLGPIFGSRSVSKEVGIHCFDDEGKQFLIAENADVFMGMLSLKKGLISDCYVFPTFRRTGVMAALIIEATKQARSYRATCTPMSEGVFSKSGFSIKKRTKNFASMEKNNA